MPFASVTHHEEIDTTNYKKTIVSTTPDQLHDSSNINSQTYQEVTNTNVLEEFDIVVNPIYIIVDDHHSTLDDAEINRLIHQNNQQQVDLSDLDSLLEEYSAIEELIKNQAFINTNNADTNEVKKDENQENIKHTEEELLTQLEYLKNLIQKNLENESKKKILDENKKNSVDVDNKKNKNEEVPWEEFNKTKPVPDDDHRSDLEEKKKKTIEVENKKYNYDNNEEVPWEEFNKTKPGPDDDHRSDLDEKEKKTVDVKYKKYNYDDDEEVPWEEFNQTKPGPDDDHRSDLEEKKNTIEVENKKYNYDNDEEVPWEEFKN